MFRKLYVVVKRVDSKRRQLVYTVRATGRAKGKKASPGDQRMVK